jgi:anthranilate synthase component 1
MYFLKIDDLHIVGASPEILVRLQNNEVTVRPIAGTIKRGSSEEEDQILADQLKNDPKEIAEHLMLIDLGRNDVGRIARVGTVKTTEQMKIEKYSHVMHLVSNVVGELKEGYSSIDVLKATHPAGTLSGAPKVRAMEIIDELEPDRRGIYGGAIGYLSWTGNMDLAIAIRTAVIQNKMLSVRAGGGVVFDSDPEAEYQESMNKAQAIIKAIEDMD